MKDFNQADVDHFEYLFRPWKKQDWFTTVDAGLILGMSWMTVLKYIKAGRIVAVNIGLGDKPVFRIHKDMIKQYLALTANYDSQMFVSAMCGIWDKLTSFQLFALESLVKTPKKLENNPLDVMLPKKIWLNIADFGAALGLSGESVRNALYEGRIFANVVGDEKLYIKIHRRNVGIYLLHNLSRIPDAYLPALEELILTSSQAERDGVIAHLNQRLSR